MKEVIRIDKPTVIPDKPVEFTHCLGDEGWETAICTPSEFEKVVYLGQCVCDGHMFAAYGGAFIIIFKGHLNSGRY